MAVVLAAPALPKSHDDSGDGERSQEQQHRTADAGDDPEQGLGQVAKLRLQALHHRGQVGMRLRPEAMDLLPDDRPLRNARWRGGHLQRVVAHLVRDVVDGVTQLEHERRGGNPDQDDPAQHHRGGREPLSASHPAGEHLVRRIERHRQDQRPHHEGEERREDLVAQHRHDDQHPGTDEDIEQP
jgi:hypothetical protein